MTTYVEPPVRDVRLPPDNFVFTVPAVGTCRVATGEQGHTVRSELRLTAAQFDEIGDGLLTSWQNLIGQKAAATYFQRSITQPPTQAEAQRRELAEAGNTAFRMLCDAMDEPVRGRFVDSLFGMVSRRDRGLVFLANRSFPWRLLYVPPRDVDAVVSEDDSTSPALDGFLGLAGDVDHRPRISNRAGTVPGTRVPLGIHPEFEKYAGGRLEHLLPVLGGVPNPVWVGNEKEFAKAVRRDESLLIYLFCHGRFGPTTGGRMAQQLLLRDNAVMTGAWLRAVLYKRLKDGAFSTSPIAIINACQGGVYPSDSEALTQVLWKHGALSTVAPLVNIPIVFAGEFGLRLLEALARGAYVGEALLGASRLFAEKHGNLLGLTYLTINGRDARLAASPNEGAP